jgi:hypothetical protein
MEGMDGFLGRISGAEVIAAEGFRVERRTREILGKGDRLTTSQDTATDDRFSLPLDCAPMKKVS